MVLNRTPNFFRLQACWTACTKRFNTLLQILPSDLHCLECRHHLVHTMQLLQTFLSFQAQQSNTFVISPDFKLRHHGWEGLSMDIASWNVKLFERHYVKFSINPGPRNMIKYKIKQNMQKMADHQAERFYKLHQNSKLSNGLPKHGGRFHPNP